MSRTRQVFPREQVAHLWAHGVQDSARDASQNFYFTGSRLHSYGSHHVIAMRMHGDEWGPLHGRILWNDNNYSATTGRHHWIAWRAMTQQQRAQCLRVPDMNYDASRDIERAIQSKKLPEFARDLTRTVQRHISALAGKRHDSGPFCSELYSARSYDATARAIYAAVGAKYPLMEIPANNADIPADKVGRAAFIAQFSRAIVESDYRDALARATQALKTAQSESTSLDGMAYDMPGNTRVLASAYDIAMRGIHYCNSAQSHYAILHPGKKSPQVAKIRKALEPIAKRFAEEQNKQKRADEMRKLETFARTYYRARRAQDEKSLLQRLQCFPGYLGNAKLSADYCEIANDSTIGIAVYRASRIEDARKCEQLADRAIANFTSAESYGSQYPKDARRLYSECVNAAGAILRKGTRVATYYHSKVADIAQRAQARAEEMHAIIIEREQQKIADWIAGRTNIPPSYDAGTYARINGDVVETSRHARVPIEHACRLARVYDRIVSAGGRDWADGAGPMVGHFRVNRIGADGSLIIGCHEFTPEEARRLRDVMASCDACKGIEE